MTPEKEKKLKELSAELEQLEKEHAAEKEMYRQAGMPGCSGTLESFTASHGTNNKINEEIQKLNK